MYSTHETGIGGSFLRISARPSIHSHHGCIFEKGERMARYGIRSNNTNSREDRDADNEQGVDEVDNIMSKPAHPIRPPSRQKNGYRRNSLEVLNTSTEYDNNVLSKSVPATLPSRLHYSTSDDDQETSNENQISDVSYQSFGALNRNSRNASFSTPQKLEPALLSQREQMKNQQSNFKGLIYLISLIAVLCAIVFSSGYNFGHISNIKSVYDKCRFDTDLSSIGEKYKVDKNSILQVQIGIATIFEKQDTGSFMFVYNSKSENFNSHKLNDFINDISLTTVKFLRNESNPLHYTTVDGYNLKMTEHSELICRYRVELADTGVMVVRHLDAIPAALAMAFHYYCDEYNPLVKKTAIFFTLDFAACPKQSSDNKTTHTLIEKCLAEKWKAIPLDSIGPLLTRVVGVLIDLTSVF